MNSHDRATKAPSLLLLSVLACSSSQAPSADGAAGVGDAGGGRAGSEAGFDAPRAPPSETYHLVQMKNIASPLPDPTGVACDATGLWIFRGGALVATDTLIHFDPTTGATDRTFTFSNPMDPLGGTPYGIAWDGTTVWLSVSGSTNTLVGVDPSTGQVTRTLPAPTGLGPSDLDFDGTNLWFSSGAGTAFVIDPSSGGIVRQFGIDAFDGGRDNGIALRPGELWVCGTFGGIEVDDPTTGQPLALATHDDGSAFQRDETGSSCFDGSQLVIVSNYGITYFLPVITH